METPASTNKSAKRPKSKSPKKGEGHMYKSSAPQYSGRHDFGFDPLNNYKREYPQNAFSKSTLVTGANWNPDQSAKYDRITCNWK